ncbi:TPA: hypothetical protein N0F65_003835 [Lagenidium giganteum]|uniref:DDE-1 domain-containing protein n=1 Tax=Lagenidium giganteum TaxID=4803 RepID=A0AAV2YVE7_9STRA|nr:TPA: hypothetical protein N0F65_003835 [Lagenidium giganteum]
MPPSRTWSEKGRGAKVHGCKHSVQVTAVLSIRAKIIEPSIVGPSVLLMDNLDVHVAEESYDIVAGEFNTTIQALPANATSTCQPLDVGVMGPLKAMIRSARLWEHEARRHYQREVNSSAKTTCVEANRSCFVKALPCAEL